MTNKYIEPHDYFSGYQDSIEKLKHDPNIVEFDRLCYEALEMNPAGKRLVKYLTDRWLVPPMAHINSANYQVAVVHAEGFKEAIRTLLNGVAQHSQRIKAEVNK